MRSPCLFFPMPRCCLHPTTSPLRSHSVPKRHPAPFQMSDPPVHSDTPRLLGVPGLAHALAMPVLPTPWSGLPLLRLSRLYLSTHLNGLTSAPSAPLAQLTHCPSASQGLGPHLPAPPLPPGCQGPPASRAQLLPALGGGGYKGALVTTKLGPGSPTPGSYELLPRENGGLPALLLPLPL